MRMCQLHMAQTTICVGIKYPEPLILDVSVPMKLIILTFPCTTAQDFFLYPDLSERRKEQPELSGYDDCFKLLHPPSSRLLQPE